MITITRNLARQLHTVFRRALNVPARGPARSVTFQTGPDGLCIRAQTHDAAVEYHVSGSHDQDEILVPFELLNDVKGAKHDDVTLETTGGGQVIAAWSDGIPQVVQYDRPVQNDRDKFPATPDKLADNPLSFQLALHDAMETADADAVRYALNHIQLDGGDGKIAATDGRQVLVQTGFTFPWDGPMLIPQRAVFACKELAVDEPVLVGKSDDWVTVRVGPWTIHFRIEQEGRFPAVADHIQNPGDAVATLQLSDADAEFLLKALKRLPSSDEFNLPVTVDLNGTAVIRAQPEDNQKPMEVLLSSSTVSGEPVRINTNRNYLARALKLGFREVCLFGPETPALCRDVTRNYVWALLGADGIIKPRKDAIRIESASAANGSHPNTSKAKRKPTTMAQRKTNENGQANSNGSQAEESVGVDAIIEQAEALKVSLRESLTKTNELIASLKRHKKANKSVQTALASLRQLQSLDA